MVKISPLIASMLIALASALPQQAASGVAGQKPTGTDVAFPSGTGGFGGQGPPGGRPSGTGFGGPAPTGGFGGPAPTGGFGGVNAFSAGGAAPSGPVPTGGFGKPTLTLTSSLCSLGLRDSIRLSLFYTKTNSFTRWPPAQRHWLPRPGPNRCLRWWCSRRSTVRPGGRPAHRGCCPASPGRRCHRIFRRLRLRRLWCFS